jgi:hypothetical protein
MLCVLHALPSPAQPIPIFGCTSYQWLMSATAYHIIGLPKNREKSNFHIKELSVTLHVNLKAPKRVQNFLKLLLILHHHNLMTGPGYGPQEPCIMFKWWLVNVISYICSVLHNHEMFHATKATLGISGGTWLSLNRKGHKAVVLRNVSLQDVCTQPQNSFKSAT